MTAPIMSRVVPINMVQSVGTPTREEIAGTLETFIRRRFQVPDSDRQFTRDANLWDGGFVDSSGVLEMILHLETTFRLTLPESVLFSPQFSSINGISSLVLECIEPREGHPVRGKPALPEKA